MITRIGQSIESAADFLRRGACVGIPTETVYGLAANGLKKEAVAKIYAAKGRPAFDPLILHIGSIGAVADLVAHFPARARLLAELFWPGPLTLILPRSSSVPDIVSAGLPTVGIRMPLHPMTLELLKMLDFPLAAPSANPFKYISPTTAEHVKSQLGGKIPYILDGGPCGIGVESTIVSADESGVRILRKGGIPVERIEEAVGSVSVLTQSTSNPVAPGMLLSHYAPATKLLLGSIPEMLTRFSNEKIAVLGLCSTYGADGIVLSASGNLEEAARRLYGALRELDQGPATLILAEFVPDTGMGRAINDRLRRAAYREN